MPRGRPAVERTFAPGAESRRAREVAELYTPPDTLRFVGLLVLAALFAGLCAAYAYLDSAAGEALRAICERGPGVLCEAGGSVSEQPATPWASPSGGTPPRV